MVFEQEILENYDYFHQDRDGYLLWCDKIIARKKESRELIVCVLTL